MNALKMTSQNDLNPYNLKGVKHPAGIMNKN